MLYFLTATASYTVSKETEVRQKIDDRHAHRDHVKPALADNYSKELDKLFWTDSECGNDYSDISSECDLNILLSQYYAES
jgi:hypothetical protein